MPAFKSILKEFFYRIGLSKQLDKLLFNAAVMKHKTANEVYKKANPAIAFPPDYYLYETYQLNYQLYIEDGNLSAKEIIEWTAKYVANKPVNILEWGCGVSRTCRHLKKYIDPNSKVFACDINEIMINWNQQNIKDVDFATISYHPPTSYDSSMFDIVFAISVFTHIDIIQQENWINEIHRILNTNAVFLFTTHGTQYFDKLISSEKEILNKTGAFTKQYFKKGHRLMSTYNLAASFKTTLEKYFEVVEFYEGKKYINKIGGQDLWIVRKK
jgi:ubiquinone/menaquinone biosynthesis C-methylase UbiE